MDQPSTRESRIEKATRIVTDSEFLNGTQAYQIDIMTKLLDKGLLYGDLRIIMTRNGESFPILVGLLELLPNRTRNIPIDRDNLGDWVRNLVARFENLEPREKTNEEFSDFFRIVRHQFTYTNLSDIGGVAVIHAMLMNRKDRLLPSLKFWSARDYYKWPHQTLFEAFMGVLFYPVESDESIVSLYLRAHVQDMLAFSAYHKNTLAQYYMLSVFEMYEEIPQPALETDSETSSESSESDDNKEDNDEDNKDNEGLTDRERREQFLGSDPFTYYFGEANKQLFGKYVSSNKDSSDSVSSDGCDLTPYYHGALLCHQADNYEKMIQHLKAGMSADSNDTVRALCAIFYAGVLPRNYAEDDANGGWKFPSDIKELVRKIDPKRVAKIDAFEVNDVDRRIQLYLEAEDYYHAGLLSYRSSRYNHNSVDYYMLAGNSGYLDGYDKAVGLYLNRGSRELAAIMYIKQGEMGDDKGYMRAGVLYAEDGDKLKALECYKKAGLDGFPNRILMASRGDSIEGPDLGTLEDEYEIAKREKYEFLKASSRSSELFLF